MTRERRNCSRPLLEVAPLFLFSVAQAFTPGMRIPLFCSPGVHAWDENTAS